MARSWCKVSAQLDSHPRIRKAGNLGRQVFEFALRRNAELDRSGCIPASHLDPDYLADMLMFTPDDARHGVSRAVTAGLLAQDGDQFVITGWDDEWGRRPMTDVERKRNQRARERKDSTVTRSHEDPVTERDSHACHGSEEIRSDQIRGEEREDAPASPPLTSPPAAPILKLEPPAGKTRRKANRAIPEGWAPRPEERAKAKDAGLNVEAEVERFRDHHTAKGTLYADWDAAFRTWIANAVRFSSERAGPRGSAERASANRDPRVGQIQPHAPSDYYVPEGEMPL